MGRNMWVVPGMDRRQRKRARKGQSEEMRDFGTRLLLVGDEGNNAHENSNRDI